MGKSQTSIPSDPSADIDLRRAMSLSLVTYAPSASSLKVRTRIAQEISGLKRTKPNVPFWRLPSHRVPTLWSLYRNLLRAAPSHNV